MILLAACSNGGGGDGTAGPSATVGTEPPRTTTTDPFAVPAVIDAAYVNRVLAGLDQIVGDVVRLVVTTKALPAEAIDRLKATYADTALLNLQLESIQRDLRAGMAGYLPQPGHKKTAVSDLIVSSSKCIYVRVSRDYSAVAANPGSQLAQQWIALTALDATADPNRYNRTNWAYIYEGFERNLQAPTVPPCTAGQ